MPGLEDTHPNESNNSNKDFPSTLNEYKADNTVFSCTKCKLFWPAEVCPFYTSESGKMKYRICPKCKNKNRMRTRPRFKKGYRDRIPAKRI